VAVGEQAAAAIHADRASDATNVPDTYRPVTAPGVWIPTTPPLFSEYAQAKGWVASGGGVVSARPLPAPYPR
jgi:hypothetical protein